MRLLPTLLLVMAAQPAIAIDYLFIGTASREHPGAIYVCQFDEGELQKPRKLLEHGRNTQIELNRDGSRLYASAAADEAGTAGDLIAFRVQPGGGLEELGRVESGVKHFCSLAVSRDGKHLLGASYDEGVVGGFSLQPDGRIGRATARLELPKLPGRKKPMARAHDVEITGDGRLAFVADIFSNRIYTLGLDRETGALDQLRFTTSENFEGPRHLILTDDEKTLFLLNQMGSSVVAFRHDGEGELRELQSVSTLPADYDGPQNHSAEILIHPSGKFLYVSNRVHDSLVGYRIGEGSFLTKLQSISSGGSNPWSFVFDSAGDHLICSNLRSNNLTVFRVDRTTGNLRRLEGEVTVPEPISLSLLADE